jgi:hypothetical protein
MIVILKGGSVRQKELAESIATFAAYTLMSKKLADRIRINLHVQQDLVKKEGAEGMCIWEDSNYRPKEFTITIDRGLKQRMFLETVAHEMVHVKQWAKGEMFDFVAEVGVCRFHGKKIDSSKMNYYDFPWEIEALGRQEGLFLRWLGENNYNNAEWAQRRK